MATNPAADANSQGNFELGDTTDQGRPAISNQNNGDNNSSPGSDDNIDGEPDGIDDATSPWPAYSNIVRGQGRYIPLRAQTAQVKAVLHRAIVDITINLVFKNAFPDGDTRTTTSLDAVYHAAKDLKYFKMATRIQQDAMYTTLLADYVNLLYCALHL